MIGTDERVQVVNATYERETKMFSRWCYWAYVRYRGLNTLAIIFGAFVPIIALLPNPHPGAANTLSVAAYAGISGAIATLFKSLDAFLKNKDFWLETNGLLARLRNERFLYDARAGKYALGKTDDCVGLFATTIAALIENERLSWVTAVNAPTDAGPDGGG